jgi:hypothetical protein
MTLTPVEALSSTAFDALKTFLVEYASLADETAQPTK